MTDAVTAKLAAIEAELQETQALVARADKAASDARIRVLRLEGAQAVLQELLQTKGPE